MSSTGTEGFSDYYMQGIGYEKHRGEDPVEFLSGLRGHFKLGIMPSLLKQRKEREA